MKKWVAYLCTVAASAVLCVAVLFWPMEKGALWQRPCVNGYSLFAAAFFVMNTIGACVLAHGVNVFAKPYTTERLEIEEKKNRVTAVTMAFFEVPLLATIFFVDDGWKMVACSVLYVGGGLVLASLKGEFSVCKMRKAFREQEKRELAEQMKKEGR